jgi:non-specific serine/threonine protein kinase
MATSVSFGDLLRQHRRAPGLTQEALAERAGLTVDGIRKLERGVTRPNRHTVQCLVAALGLSDVDQVRLHSAVEVTCRPRRVREAVDAPLHNLPVSITSFVGRQSEVAEVVRRLDRVRLLTLTGIGGCGKTRLALEVARTVLDRYPDGVWLVELAPIADATLVPHLVGTAVGVREGPDQTPLDALRTALRNRHLLLVLDNCEHLLETCARLVDDLVRACGQVSVLATSRETLGLTGEIAWRVPSLAVPEACERFTLPEIRRSAAVQLFVERATAWQSSFALTERNATAVAQICRRLDGIPLALELAAARTSALGSEQIAARLDHCFRLLTGGSRAALPRQQTLRATLDWSYDLLTKAERLMLNRLAVFAGGWSLEAAEVICADEQIGDGDVVDMLAQLVNKSLVIADAAGDGRERYGMLETVRQYALEQLVAEGETELMRRRHAQYFMKLSEQLDTEVVLLGELVLATGEQLDYIEIEQDNLRTALRWWIDSQDAGQAIRQACLLWQFWFFRGSVTEGHTWLLQALALPPASGSHAMRRRALPALSHLATRHGDYAVALEALEELLAGQRSDGDPLRAAYTLMQLANVHFLTGAYAVAWVCLEDSRAETGEVADKRFESFWKHYGAMLSLCEGRYDLAQSLAAGAVKLFEAEQRRLWAAYSRVTHGTADREVGRYEDASSHFADVLKFGLEVGDRTLVAHCLEGFSGVASAYGRHELALRLGAAAVAIRERDGAPVGPAWEPILDHWLTTSRQVLGEEAASSAWAAGRVLSIEQVLELAEVLPVDPADHATAIDELDLAIGEL